MFQTTNQIMMNQWFFRPALRALDLHPWYSSLALRKNIPFWSKNQRLDLRCKKTYRLKRWVWGINSSATWLLDVGNCLLISEPSISRKRIDCWGAFKYPMSFRAYICIGTLPHSYPGECFNFHIGLYIGIGILTGLWLRWKNSWSR